MDTNLDGIGRLTARVSSGLGTIPIEGASVYIMSYAGNGDVGGLLYNLRTNVDGLTETVSLSSPDREASLRPGSDTIPYSEYVMTVSKQGYRPVENIGIPIFDGITSVQTVNLIPLSATDRESGNVVPTVYYENGGYTNLRSDGDFQNSEVSE